nr:MAG TPA: hypothetical protein [Bacteriophage sp.]
MSQDSKDLDQENLNLSYYQCSTYNLVIVAFHYYQAQSLVLRNC